ncbi:MAG: hypothetical protein R3349_08435 [Geminicoccaceae bacterium]|nr:hypothetical protein [Geminicoccaceae bacterium]
MLQRCELAASFEAQALDPAERMRTQAFAIQNCVIGGDLEAARAVPGLRDDVRRELQDQERPADAPGKKSPVRGKARLMPLRGASTRSAG